MIYGYIRVSTDKQTTENQRFEIRQFAEKNGIIINRWFEETISGATDFRQRKLGKLLKKLTKNDILIASEISRLGRNMLQVMTILHYCRMTLLRFMKNRQNRAFHETAAAS